MTQDQLNALLLGVRNIFAGDTGVAPAAVTPINANSNFSKCQSRFAGKKNEDCDAFIDAINVYKECLQISDANAIKGLSMLLDGLAATWYQGVKATITSWDDALKALRHAFGFNKPPHQIFRELFSKEQGEKEPTDVFVTSARALLARLPSTPELHQTHQIDMIYGLLNRKIRQRLPRKDVKTFNDLIDKARSIEDSFAETSVQQSIGTTASSEKHSKLRPKFWTYTSGMSQICFDSVTEFTTQGGSTQTSFAEQYTGNMFWLRNSRLYKVAMPYLQNPKYIHTYR
ncbi:hypothetical protein RI129_001157 [Pyrocoelia pectoralis]|uniref:Uncharacterized protein n=1 Tax=Pyrocoelia pectoralis TaxID=417401 RepID=A0AAN7VVY9_9COLE